MSSAPSPVEWEVIDEFDFRKPDIYDDIKSRADSKTMLSLIRLIKTREDSEPYLLKMFNALQNHPARLSEDEELKRDFPRSTYDVLVCFLKKPLAATDIVTGRAAHTIAALHAATKTDDSTADCKI